MRSRRWRPGQTLRIRSGRRLSWKSKLDKSEHAPGAQTPSVTCTDARRGLSSTTRVPSIERCRWVPLVGSTPHSGTRRCYHHAAVSGQPDSGLREKSGIIQDTEAGSMRKPAVFREHRVRGTPPFEDISRDMRLWWQALVCCQEPTRVWNTTVCACGPCWQSRRTQGQEKDRLSSPGALQWRRTKINVPQVTGPVFFTNLTLRGTRPLPGWVLPSRADRC